MIRLPRELAASIPVAPSAASAWFFLDSVTGEPKIKDEAGVVHDFTGATGSQYLSGAINPTTEGVDGDFYFNTATRFIFGPKAAGVWPAGTSLAGAAGPAPSGTGLVEVVAGVLQTPVTLSDRVAADPVNLRTQLGLGTAATQPAAAFDAAGAAAAAQAFAIQRGNHSGTQLLATISDAGNAAGKNVGVITGTVAAGDDSRFSDPATPTDHAASHAAAGSDPVTLAQSQVTSLTSDLALKAPLASPALTGVPSAPTAAANTNTTQLANTAFVQQELAAAVSGLLDFKGSTDASANPNYPSALKGDTYYINVAGKIGGASGKSVDIGDAVIASADNAGGAEASVGASWFVLEHNLTGALLAANDLSDLASAVAARTNLGLGTAATQPSTAFDPAGSAAAAQAASQPLDSDLTTLSNLIPTTDNFIQSKAGAWASRTIAQVKTDLSLSGTNAGDQVFIQDTTPTVTAPSIFVQTGLGSTGEDFMLWALTP